VHRFTKSIALTVALAATATACGGSDDNGPLGDVQALIVLQRQARNEMGDIFQYTSYLPGGKLVMLSPPTADGVQTVICCDQDADFSQADISAYDLSFDANMVNGAMTGEVVFSAKLTGGDPYALFIMSLETGQIEQLYSDPGRDVTMPVFLAGGRVAFMTNQVVEGQGSPQFQDEYERGTTLQLGVINRDGTGLILGPRNLSHRTSPSALSSGRVLFTQWDHLGPMNAGHFMQANPNFTQLREVFGKEGTGLTNSYLKGIEVSPGRIVGIGTSRDRTIQSGKILDIRLGTPRTLAADETINGITWPKGSVVADVGQSEANATFRDYTPDVPGDRDPSRNQVGRYYDAYPLNAKDYPDLLVSWADGPVESGTLGAAGLTADFGVYLYDTKRGTRLPIMNTPDVWDVFPRPLRPRPAPLLIADTAPDSNAGDGVLVGSVNAYDSSIFNITPGSIYGVRMSEGFSSEEGFPEMFGNTEFEGQAVLAVAPLADDNSWAAKVPANVPLHFQMIDKFGQSQANEPVWTSGRAGEARVCGGCHENRTEIVTSQPGLLHAVVQGPVDAYSSTPRFSRTSTNYGRDNLMGVPWDLAVQPIFNQSCVSCHDGSAGSPGWTAELTDDATGQSVQFHFDLTATPMNLSVGQLMITEFSHSYVSMAGFSMEDLREAGVTLTCLQGTCNPGMLPQDYAHSETAKRVNPVQQFPNQDPAIRVLTGSAVDPVHNNLGLTPDQHYILTVASDLGINWYSRENKP
jgi:hypothetical protein